MDPRKVPIPEQGPNQHSLGIQTQQQSKSLIPHALGTNIARLCDNCSDVVFRDGPSGLNDTPPHIWNDQLPDLPELMSSYQKGCDFCFFLRSIILSKVTEYAFVKIIGKGFKELGTTSLSISVTRWRYGLVILLNVSRVARRISLYCKAIGAEGAENVTKLLGLPPPSIPSYSDAHHIEWMRGKLEDCKMHNHKQFDEDFAPARLIDVRPSNPQLVLRGEYDIEEAPSQVPVYAALSYCWGSPEDALSQLTTTKETISQRRGGIRHHEMTKVLQDAVFLARELDIRYLWIDSLCIIQKDNEDWETQSADISKIFGNARVTLCDASSSSCHGGFLHRNLQICLPFQSIRQPNIKGSYILRFVSAEGCSYSSDFTARYQFARYQLDQSRWMSRAWVFQERLSSTCMLIFGQSNLHFMCRNSVEVMGFEVMGFNRRDSEYRENIFEARNRTRDQVYLQWRQLSCDYGCYEKMYSFTKSTDLLPAISGLAKYFHQYLKDKYLAGIWERDLLLGLMWHTWPSMDDHIDPLADPLSSNKPYMVPSWSMLGRGRRIYPWKDSIYRNVQNETNLLRGETDVVGDNPYGSIKGGRLIVQSKILDLTGLKGNNLSVRYHEPRNLNRVLHYDTKQIATLTLDFDGHNIMSFKLLLLGSYRYRRRGATENGRGAFGLIICQVPNSAEFYRVGIFKSDPRLDGMAGGGLGMFEEMGELKDVVVI